MDLALSVEGLGAAPATLKAYCDLLATSLEDFGDPQARSDFAVMSSCALTVRGLWWRAGVRHPILLAKYREQHAVDDVIQIGRDAKAVATGDPDRGDVVIMQGPAGAHVLTVLELRANPDGSRTLVSIDGGQRDAQHNECILRRERRYTPGHLDGYPILYRFDCTLIAAVEQW